MSTKNAMINLAIGTLLVLVAGSFIASDSSGGVNDPTLIYEFNCNDPNLSFKYMGGTTGEITVEWVCEGVTFEGDLIQIDYRGPDPNDSWAIFLDPDQVSSCKNVYITQTVSKNGLSAQQKFIVHMARAPPANEHFYVYFYDGYSANGGYCGVDEITSSRFAGVNENFVHPPATPKRIGYHFVDWFIDGDYSKPLILSNPVESNLTAIAKWIKEDDSSINPPVNPDGPNEPNLPDRPDPVLNSIYITGSFDTDYIVGEELNTTGLAVFAKYSDGTDDEVTSKCTFSPTKFNKTGSALVTVEYEGKTTSFTVSVSEDFTPGGDTDPDTPDKPPIEPVEPDKGGNGISNYLLIAVALLLVVLIAAVILRSRH